jgi:predicted DNA-binding transcriptional regulator YafY
MDRTERFHLIDMMLSQPEPATFARLQARLEVSRATLKRDLEYLRNRLNAPIVWDRETRGYRYLGSHEAEDRLGPQYELPGLWFSSAEIHALLTMQHLLANLDPGGIADAAHPALDGAAQRVAGHGARTPPRRFENACWWWAWVSARSS